MKRNERGFLDQNAVGLMVVVLLAIIIVYLLWHK